MRKLTNSKGSILIWTLLLGISLTTVFFFFSQRLNSNAASQHETIQYQNARLFLESYVAYLEGLSAAELEPLRGNIDFDGITGTLTNETEEITSTLDAGGSVSYSANIPNAPTDNIKVEWGTFPTAKDTELLEINSILAVPAFGGGIDPYGNVTQTTEETFSLNAPSGPTSYRLTQINGSKLYDNVWQLGLELPLGFRRKLTISTSFTPSS